MGEMISRVVSFPGAETGAQPASQPLSGDAEKKLPGGRVQ